MTVCNAKSFRLKTARSTISCTNGSPETSRGFLMSVIASEWRAQETQETVSQSFLFARILTFDATILTCFATVVSRSKRILSLKLGKIKIA